MLDTIKTIIIVTGALFFNETIWLVIIWPLVGLFMYFSGIDLIAIGSAHPAYIIGWNILHDVVGYVITSYRQNFYQDDKINKIFTLFFVLYTIIGFLVGFNSRTNPHLEGINYPWIMAGVFILRFMFIYFLYKKYEIKKLLNDLKNNSKYEN